ncbi:MAG: Hpt domain-containing protein [Methyloligellaceae bacterium]
MELTVEGFVAQSAEAPGPSRSLKFRRPVDLVELARYTLGNRSHEREVLELFCTQSGCCLKRLEATTSDSEWQKVARTIKGSARCIGAWSVVETAAAAEALEGAVLAARRSEIVETLAQEIGKTNAFIRRLLIDA